MLSKPPAGCEDEADDEGEDAGEVGAEEGLAWAAPLVAGATGAGGAAGSGILLLSACVLSEVSIEVSIGS